MKYLALIPAVIALSTAASVGSWSGSSVGGRLSVGGQMLVSRPITPPQPPAAAGQVFSLSWRITLLSPPPPGLQIKLCTPSICYPLHALSGTRQIDGPLSAHETFRFIYSVAGRGTLLPALQVVSNQLTLNYH